MKALQFNKIYRSNPQIHVRYVNGERKEEEYFLLYIFRDGGIWIGKTLEDGSVSVEEFMEGIDLAEVLSDPHHNEPQDASGELLYQSGEFEINNDTLYMTWKHKDLEEKERKWYFRLGDEGFHSDFGEYEFRLAGE